MAPNQTGESVCYQAFAHWEHLHKSLVTLIDDYYNACISLRSTCTQYSRFPYDKHAQKEVMEKLDFELPSVLLCEKKLGNIRVILQGTRNTSRDIVLFNSFPPEILSRIFGFAVRYCASDELATESCPSVIAGVCRHWRQVAMHTPSLWSHIDLEVGGLFDRGLHKRAQTWLERSRKTLLHIHTEESDAHNSDYHDLMQPKDLIDVLEPHADRFSSLDLNWSEHDWESKVFCALTKAWLKTGTPGVLKSITLFAGGSKKAEIASFFHEMFESGHWSHERPNPLLLAVTTLTLHGAYFPFESGAFHGLTELRLSGEVTGDRSSLLHQLVKVLGASPNLRTLILFELKLRTSAETCFTPVRLGQLEHLNLVDLEPKSASALLSYLVPESESLDLSVELSEEDASIEQLEALLERSSVTTLYLKLPSSTASFDWAFSLSFPHARVRRLALEGLQVNIGDNSFNAMSHLMSLPSFASISEIYLLHANLRPDLLHQLLSAFSNPTIHLWGCVIDGCYKKDDLAKIVASGRNEGVDMKERLIIYSESYHDNPIRHWTIHPQR